MSETPEFVEVLFRGPTRFLEAFGQTVERGHTAFFHRSEIFSLQSNDRIEIEVLGAAEASPAVNPAKPAAVKRGEGRPKSNQEEEA